MATVGVPIPDSLVRPVLDKLDALKSKFLAVPANVRASLDKLTRVRMEINKLGNVPPEVNQSAQLIENNLKRVQQEWQNAADRFTQLDDMRRVQSLLTWDGVQLASSLALSATYVLKNADSSMRAVNDLAAKYLSAEQQRTIDVATVGVPTGMSLGTVALIGAAIFFFSRRR